MPLTFVTLGLYRNRTLQEFTRTGTSKDSTLLNHINKPKTHFLLFKFTDLSMGHSQTSHSVPPVPQGCDTSGNGATVGLAETEGEANPWDSAQELRKLRLQRAQRTWGFREEQVGFYSKCSQEEKTKNKISLHLKSLQKQNS